MVLLLLVAERVEEDIGNVSGRLLTLLLSRIMKEAATDLPAPASPEQNSV